MGALKNACHYELEAKRGIEENMPGAAKVFKAVAEAISPHLCASDRAKGEHWVIALDVLNVPQINAALRFVEGAPGFE